jgi:ankyrin repeat protein
MNYEKKYLKYKMKYLQLVSKKQTGGLRVVWPVHFLGIKPGDKVKVLDVKLMDGIDPDPSVMIDIEKVKKEQKYLTVLEVSNDVLILQNGKENIFNKDIFKNVVLDKQVEELVNKVAKVAKVTKRDVDLSDNCFKFITTQEATTYDNLLLDGSISNADVRGGYLNSGLHQITLTCYSKKDADIDILLSYLLTCDPPADVNAIDRNGVTPMYMAASNNKTSVVKLLIDFGGDRTIETKKFDNNPRMTPLDIAIELNNKEAIEVLTKYFPTEEEKLDSQLASKQRVDAYFRDKGHPRFKQDQIDLKFQSIEAVRNGKLKLLELSIPYVDLRMAVSLTLIAIDREQNELIGCLLKKLAEENVFEVITDEKSVEPLLLSGIDPNFKKPPADIVNIIKNSLILTLIKILHHKFIDLDFGNLYEMIQTFIDEGLK